MSVPATREIQAGDVEALAERLVGATLGALDLISIYLGDRLGWYRSLLRDGPATATELAARTDTHPRYAREWLEQQAVTDFLTVEDAADPEQRRFTLPPGMAEAMTDEQSLAYLAPLGRLLAAATSQLPALLAAYRHGGGVGWAAYGADAREAQAAMNRPWYGHALPDALRCVPDIDALLRRPGARIADIGCGGGWSTISLARTYPEARLDGFDLDPASVELAIGNAAESGVADRTSFRAGDTTAMLADSYDAVFAFECVHDMAQPVEVLAAARRALRPGGSMVIMDEAVAESFAAPGDETERLMYGFSLTVCLPDGMSHQPSAGTGTVLRPATLRGYARQAGFADLEILPIEGFGFWRFYRLLI